MNATIKLENEKHFPVLLDKLISIISPLYGGTFIDCTFGAGGYSKKILEDNSNNLDSSNLNEISNTLSDETSNEAVVSEVANENSDFDSKSEELETEKNGLENFELNDDDSPELFNSDTNEEVLTTSDEINSVDEEDLEIPAFLRRQKN